MEVLVAEGVDFKEEETTEDPHLLILEDDLNHEAEVIPMGVSGNQEVNLSSVTRALKAEETMVPEIVFPQCLEIHPINLWEVARKLL